MKEFDFYDPDDLLRTKARCLTKEQIEERERIKEQTSSEIAQEFWCTDDDSDLL